MTNICEKEIERLVNEARSTSPDQLERLWRIAEQDAELPMDTLSPIGAGLGTATGWLDAQFNFFVWHKLRVFERVIKELEQRIERLAYDGTFDSRTDSGPDDDDQGERKFAFEEDETGYEAYAHGARPQGTRAGEQGLGTGARASAGASAVPSEAQGQAQSGPRAQATDA